MLVDAGGPLLLGVSKREGWRPLVAYRKEGARRLLVQQQWLDGHAPALLIEGLTHFGQVPGDVGVVFQTTLIRFSQFNQPIVLVAPVLAPSAD